MKIPAVGNGYFADVCRRDFILSPRDGVARTGTAFGEKREFQALRKWSPVSGAGGAKWGGAVFFWLKGAWVAVCGGRKVATL